MDYMRMAALCLYQPINSGRCHIGWREQSLMLEIYLAKYNQILRTRWIHMRTHTTQDPDRLGLGTVEYIFNYIFRTFFYGIYSLTGLLAQLDGIKSSPERHSIIKFPTYKSKFGRELENNPTNPENTIFSH